MAKTMQIRGKSGAIHTFSVHSYDPGVTAWNEVAGVYIVTKRTAKENGGGDHTMLYVGQTENLGARHASHHKEVCFMNNGANCLLFLSVKAERDRFLIETDIRNNGFSWTCNDQ